MRAGQVKKSSHDNKPMTVGEEHLLCKVEVERTVIKNREREEDTSYKLQIQHYLI